MEKQKLSPNQIAEMHHYDLLDLLDHSRKRIEELHVLLETKPTPELQKEYDQEFKKFTDLTITFLNIDDKEH